jgi:glycosyltransferase involved in cell wall biosynthesis
MNIAVNTRLLLPGKFEGIAWFTYETMKRITIAHPEHKFIFFFDRKFSDEFIFANNIEPVVVHPQARHPVLWYLYFDFGVTAALKKHKADLFVSPDGWLSLRTNVPSINVMHDLNYATHPEFIPYLVRNYYHYFFPRFAAKAARIGTVSEYTRNDIVEKFKVRPEKIDVVYSGANDKIAPVSPLIQESMRKKYTGGKPFFLFVGSLHPRKNLGNLFRAYDCFRSKTAADIKLLIVGEKKWWMGDIVEAYNQLHFKNDVIFIGKLSTEELHQVIGSALAMTYVSFFEGFGLPIVEAFNSDVPVITSNKTAMPEVAGDAALLVDPYSVDSICEALVHISEDSALRQSLIEKGRVRRKLFSWQNTADLLWETIEKTIYSKP